MISSKQQLVIKILILLQKDVYDKFVRRGTPRWGKIIFKNGNQTNDLLTKKGLWEWYYVML